MSCYHTVGCINEAETTVIVEKECRIGYISDFGERCRKCPEGFYGKKCIGVCSCKVSESCHHIEGCIKEAVTTLIVEQESTTDTYVKSHQVTTVSSLSSNKSSNGKTVPDLTKRELVVYSIGIGGFTCIVVLLLCLGRYKLNILRNRSVTLDNENTRNNVRVSMVSIRNTEGIYETIDESNMIDNILEVTVHVPITVGTTSIETSSENTTDDEHSLLDTEYLNPYQPMVHDAEEHVYEFNTLLNAEVSWSTESEENSSGYCNPSYQHPVPYYANQSVLSIQEECHCLGSSTSGQNLKENKYRKEKDLEQIENENDTQNEEDIELQNSNSHNCKEGNSNNEMELEIKSISNEKPVDNIEKSSPADG